MQQDGSPYCELVHGMHLQLPQIRQDDSSPPTTTPSGRIRKPATISSLELVSMRLHAACQPGYSLVSTKLQAYAEQCQRMHQVISTLVQHIVALTLHNLKFLSYAGIVVAHGSCTWYAWQLSHFSQDNAQLVINS